MDHENKTLATVEDKIITLRGQQVILDCDVAELYGVETKRINEAVANNPQKFPEGYIMTIGFQELTVLRSKFSSAKISPKLRVLPKAFTEKGLYMLATILKSPKAVETTLAIVETFAKLRELARTVEQLSTTSSKKEQEALINHSGQLLDDIISRTTTKQTVETSFELNIAMVKVKRLVRREENVEN